jgi:hypothetical protein
MVSFCIFGESSKFCVNVQVPMKWPQTCRFVVASGYQPVVIRADRQRSDRALMAAQKSNKVSLGKAIQARMSPAVPHC